MSGDPELVLGIVGSTGRLGTAILDECSRRHIKVTLEACSKGWRIECAPLVIVDASTPGALNDTLNYCHENRTGLIYAVSSITADAYAKLVTLSRSVSVVVAENLSMGHWLQLSLIRKIALLTASFENQPRMSVFERHPVTKVDQPSASARSLANLWARLAKPCSHGEVTAQRAGQPVSDHTVLFDLPGASLSIGHHVGQLKAAAPGALIAARYATSRKSGLSTMFDVYNDTYGPSIEESGTTAHVG